MGSVAWLKHETGHEAITIESAREYPRVFVALGGRHWRVTVAMHFVPELRRSLPHMEERCEWCRFPATVKCYVPCVLSPVCHSADVQRMAELKGFPRKLTEYSWKPKVVEVPPSAAGMLATLDRGSVFAIWRLTGRDSKKVGFRIFTNECDPALPPFDVRPYLEKCWGLRIPAEMQGK